MSERPRLIGRTGPAGARLLGFGSVAAQPRRHQRRPRRQRRRHQRRVDPQPRRHRRAPLRRRRTSPWSRWRADAGAKALADAGLSPHRRSTRCIVATCTMPSPIPNAAAQTGRPASGSTRPARSTSTPRAPVLLRHRRRGRLIRVGQRRATCWWSARKALRLARHGGPVELHHLRRRRGRCVVGPADEPRIGAGRRWGSAGDLVDDRHRRERPHLPGGPVGVPLGHHADRADRERAVEAAGVKPADIDVLVPHQANLRIVEAHRARSCGPGRPRGHGGRRRHRRTPATPRRPRSRWRIDHMRGGRPGALRRRGAAASASAPACPTAARSSSCP